MFFYGKEECFTKIKAKNILKWVPVAIAAVVAASDAISTKKDQERLDDLEKAISELTKKGDS